MLSKKEWSTYSHTKGEPWSIGKIESIRTQVENKAIIQTPGNLKGCTQRPLIDSVPIENFILSVLHIIIGMGNTLIDAFLEWIEERVEKVEVSNWCLIQL